MKKIFTLLFCTAIISSAFAQDDHRDWNNRNNTYRDRDEYRQHHEYGHNRRSFSINFFVYQNNRYRFGQRDELIARISSNYDYQVQQVINDWSLSPREKRYGIRSLQAQKAREINNIYAQCGDDTVYPDQYRHHDHHDDDDD
jgi:hypothetical protein